MPLIIIGSETRVMTFIVPSREWYESWNTIIVFLSAVTVPESGASRDESILRSVVLPAPDAPAIPSISPCERVRDNDDIASIEL